jgi:signal transduction histidine kinase
MMKHWEELYQGKAYADVEFRLIGKSGKMKWCSSTWGPLLDEHGRQIGVQGRERDITQHKQLEREVLESAANERRRIGHDLHDGLGQHLAGIALKTKALEESLIAEESKEARVAKQLVGLMNQAIGQTRNLAHGLDPVHVEADGLVAALGKLAAQSSELSGVKCIFGCGQKRLAVSAQAGLELYRIAQEAIHNAVKHGRARRIEIELDMDAAHLRLSIRDDGKGFDAQAASTAGMGSHIMRYRANSLQGRLTIHSQPAKGTHVECLVPKQFCLARVGRTVVRE